jgi:hypothetical protein
MNVAQKVVEALPVAGMLTSSMTAPVQFTDANWHSWTREVIGHFTYKELSTFEWVADGKPVKKPADGWPAEEQRAKGLLVSWDASESKETVIDAPSLQHA